MAKKSNKNIPLTPIVEHIDPQPIDDLMSNRYGVYAKYVIQDRAIPDARDGLKPVQRRIIYSMHLNGNSYDKPTKKCAKIVGDVMGRFHPHGDTSIYDALVRMSQNWKMSMPLIQFQGNNGSIDDDPPAAYRYTEAKLNEFSDFLVKDIDKNTVDMTLNFDDTELEPIVLPSRYPNLYVNGSSGIAVAIATEIPPHNLTEVCEAAIYRINHPHCSLDDLLEFIKGPDFPTGGLIYQSSGIRDIYETGRGRIEVASKVDIVPNKEYNDLIVREIPFGVIKQSLAYSIDQIRKNREIDGIVDVKDLSSGDEIKIVITCKKEIDPKIILSYLMKRTQLKISYSSNCVAICNDHPNTMTLEYYLDTYIAHQVDVITRRSNFDLEKAKNRLHIVEGLIKAINVIDEVVKIIRKSKDKADAKQNIMKAFGFSEKQAEAIVMMPLYKLTNADVTVYLNEKSVLESTIKDLKETLSNPTKLKHIIVDDLKAVVKKYGAPRRTQIVEETPEIVIDKRDLIIKEDCYVVITKDGYVKRSPLKSYKASEGLLPGLKQGDTLECIAYVNTVDFVLCFTNKGNYLCLPVDEIAEGKWKDEGKHVNYMCNLPLEESIIKCIVVKDFEKKVNIALVTKKGQIKKTKLVDFYAPKCSKPIQCMRLMNGDEVVDVAVLNGDNNIFIITEAGYSTFFSEREITPIGLKGSGVKAISTLRDSHIQTVLAYKRDEKGKIFVLTKQGCQRIYDIGYADLTARLGKTQAVFKSFKSSPHALIYAAKILDKEQPIKLNCLMNDDSVMSFEFNDFHLTPIETYAKKNFDFNEKLVIKDVYIENVEVIDSSTKEEKGHENFKPKDFFAPPKEKKEEAPKVENKPKVSIIPTFGKAKVNTPNTVQPENKEDEKEDDNIEQISIFDDMGD